MVRLLRLNKMLIRLIQMASDLAMPWRYLPNTHESGWVNVFGSARFALLGTESLKFTRSHTDSLPIEAWRNPHHATKPARKVRLV